MRSTVTLSLIALLGLAATACAEPPAIDARAASELVQKKQAVLVDVRESDEVAEGMAAPAQWLPLSRIQGDGKALSDFLSRQAKGTTLIFYCAGGGRAESVAQLAASKGFKVANMGGFRSWVKAGLPTKKP